jgi:predicted O-linked N-acetylglucosamine transferase (SPINDLY family)
MGRKNHQCKTVLPIFKIPKALNYPVEPSIQQAIGFHQQGQLVQAEALYRRIIEIEPKNSDAIHLLGVIASQTGHLQSAIELISQAIEINSEIASYHSNIANVFQELKLFEAAVESYDKAIALEPGYAEAYSNRGNALLALLNFEAALKSFEKAISIKPDFVNAFYNCGNAFLALRKFNEAVICYEKAISSNPYYAEAYINRGKAFQELKQFKAAIESYDKAISIKPNYPEAFYNKANVLQELGEFEAAVKSYDKAIVLDPGYAEAFSNRGNALISLGHLDAAIASFDDALAIKSDFAHAFYNRGYVLQLLKHYVDAIESYEKAIIYAPSFSEAYLNRGISLQKLRRFDDAIASYDRAIYIKPDYPEAYSNRGTTLHERKLYALAIDSFEKSIALKPDFADGFYNRSNALRALKKFDLEVESLDSAFTFNPGFEYILGKRLNARLYICKWQDLSKDLATCESEIALLKPVTTPFIALLLFDKPELHYLSSLILTRSKHPKNPQLGDIIKSTGRSKLRIGYYSADLHYHPVPIWLVALLENHDKSKFELFAFSFRNDINDPMRARLEAVFDHFIAVDRMSDLEVTKLSRQLGIDIAIDLNGHTADGRPDIFAARAAPIQVSHIGFPSTMGAEYIDYFICDEYSVPENSKQYFTEKMAYVPCPYTYDRKRQVSKEPLRRADFGLPESAFVFTCQNGCQKIGTEVFGTWMDILKAIPEGVLWLLEPHPTAVENLRKEAQARGVKDERLIFTGREVVKVEQEEARIARYLASYKLADLFLDTWPYNAGTTAVDALWAGLPVLTKVGRAFVARMAASFLTALEVEELITDTAQKYKELAIELATDTEKLSLIKQKIQVNIEKTALFDTADNTRSIESAYLEMYRRHQADLPPEHLSISRSAY